MNGLEEKKGGIKWLCIVVLFMILLLGNERTAFASEVVYFGSYPQTEVTDETVITAIENAIKAEDDGANSEVAVNEESADTGRSVWVDGVKYCRISAENTNHADNFGTDKTYRYFKWERISWKVLENDGETMFLVADRALDCKGYNETRQDVTWEKSTLRSWLNGYDAGRNVESVDYSTDSFWKNAFSKVEQEAIVQKKIENNDNARYNTPGGNATDDFIYLLSMEEVTKESYGFSSNSEDSSVSRQIKSSDFAYVKGVARSISTGGEGNCGWWLRSPGMYSYDAAYINSSGYVNKVGLLVPYEDIGVCPALYIRLASNDWYTENDGTSGDGGEERILTDLQVAKTKTVYTQGETLNVDDLQVTAWYSHSCGEIQKTLSANAYTTNAAAIDMNISGSKILTVAYTEGGITKKVNINITVNEKTTQESENNGQNQPVKVTKLTIKAPSKRLAAGKKVQLIVSVLPENATNTEVSWKTSNKKYATVSTKGIVTLKKAGIGKNVTITATAKDGSGKKASVKIKIMKNAVKRIKVTAPKKTLKAGKSMTLNATVTTTGKHVNKTLKWKSSNTKYATVNKKGKVTAKKAGKGKTVTITAVSTDGSNKKGSVKIKIQ